MGFLVLRSDLINYFGIIFIILSVFLFAVNEYRKIPEKVEDFKLNELNKIILLYVIIAIILISLWELILDFVIIAFHIVSHYHG